MGSRPELVSHGSTILFARHIRAENDTDIWAISPDGTNLRRFLPADSIDEWRESLGTDGADRLRGQPGPT